MPTAHRRVVSSGRSRIIGSLTALAALTALAGGVVATPAALADAPITATPIAPTSPLCTPRSQPVAPGLSLVSDLAVNARLHDLTLHSGAMQRDVHVYVLLPRGYDPSTRYPVLLLLHGHGGGYKDWVDHDVAGVLDSSGRTPLITVMPDGGYDGFYSDWYGTDVLDASTRPTSPPAWESFHIRELLPWIDAHYPTIADRGHRFVAGLSMGGFGTMSYAARHPDVFGAAGSFSGAVYPDSVYPLGPIGQQEASNLPDGKPADRCIWGDPATQDVVWRDHDPTELARNLSSVRIFLASGDGIPAGRHDDPTRPNPGGMLVENAVYQENLQFGLALDARGIPHQDDFYGPGVHDWPYWRDDLGVFLDGTVRDAINDKRTPAAPPKGTFDFESAATTFSAWGWSFTAHRDVAEMTYLDRVGSHGLFVRGSGKLDVVTAALYPPNSAHSVSIRGLVPGTSTSTADAAGRLRFQVDLGPSHLTQQYLFGPVAEATFAPALVRIS
ncbi:MAG: alpha/beta hydrolase [Acidimicrobiales bacterium]